ncbi:MAG: hypothetical protein MOB07_15710 [Acidobacteria bacterium]|nr:hypothetical protein [Acidobacteriota bacterium]
MKDSGSQVRSQALAADSACQAERRAVLVFAGAMAADLARRRWPVFFQPLLQTQTYDAEWSGGTDVYFFTAAGITPPDLPAAITIHSGCASPGNYLLLTSFRSLLPENRSRPTTPEFVRFAMA